MVTILSSGTPSIKNTVESSTFGSEFIAMKKLPLTKIEALRYKLQMMGVALDGEMNEFCDNESVFKNSIAHHHICVAQAVNIVCILSGGRVNGTSRICSPNCCCVIDFHFLVKCILLMVKMNPSFFPKMKPPLGKKNSPARPACAKDTRHII